MDWPFLLSITALAVGGILLGNRLSHKFSAANLKKSFGWFVLVMGCWILLREFI